MRRLLKEMFQKKRLFVVLLTLIFAMNMLSGSSVTALAGRDKTSPQVPQNFHVVTITDKSVSLAWSASTDNVKVTNYEVYRNSIMIGTSTTTSCLVTGLKPLTTYKFYIKAKDAAGNSSASSVILSVSTTATPTPTPTVTPTPIVTPIPTLLPSPTPTTAPTPTPAPLAESKVIGYYAAWAAYSGFTPDRVDASKLTHINYAFANIGSDLKIALGYPDVDPSNITKLNALKLINPNLKTVISVGGWEWSGRFSDAALTDASRTTFADSCVNFIVQYGFDGVDLDWEYPVTGGLSTNVRRVADKTNFTLLMQKLREKLDARGVIDGKHYLLTFAGASGSWYLNNIEPAKLKLYVDYVNVMTYDIHGNWDTYTDFNAPLYKNSDVSPQYKDSVDSGITAWQNAGFPANQIIMGVPFYGYIYKSVTNANQGLYQSYSGGSSISYANVVGNYLNAAGYVKYFHAQSLVPWLFNGTTFITYEDEQSMGYKAQYIKDKGLGGAMIWELSQDPNRVLLNALYNGLK
jgi:chitinase